MGETFYVGKQQPEPPPWLQVLETAPKSTALYESIERVLRGSVQIDCRVQFFVVCRQFATGVAQDADCTIAQYGKIQFLPEPRAGSKLLA